MAQPNRIFTYDHNLPIADNILNMGRLYRIRYGLRYTVSDNIHSGVKRIGGFTFKELDKPLVGEQLLNKVAQEHLNKVYGSQRSLLLESATALFNHEDNVTHKYWKTFNECYEMFTSTQQKGYAEGEEPDFTPSIAAEIEAVVVNQEDWLSDAQASIQEAADAILCFFLNKRSNDGTDWDFDLLVSQPEDVKEELRSFMNEEIAVQTSTADADEEEEGEANSDPKPSKKS